MTRRAFFMVYLGLLIVFSNGSTFYAKFEGSSTRKITNATPAREIIDHPFHFHEFVQDTDEYEDGTKEYTKQTEMALCPMDLPILCYNDEDTLCVEHDKIVFNDLITENARQTVTFSQNGGSSVLFQTGDQFECRQAQKQTNLTIEEFEFILTELAKMTQLKDVAIAAETLNVMQEDALAICKVSDKDYSQYFEYSKQSKGSKALKNMIKIKSKEFCINGKEISLICHPKTDKHTAKHAFEELEKDRQKENTENVDHTETGSKKSKTGSPELQTDDKWYENDKYQLGLILLCCIIVVTLSLCCCTTNNGDPDNEDPNNHYPASTDLVLEVLDTVSSLSIASSTDSLPPSIGSTTDSTVAESTLSKSVDPEEITEFETRSVELTKVIRTQPNSVEEKENTESQKKSTDLKEDIQPQSNSVELKEDTQSQTTSLVLEDAQSQSDALEKENTQSETDSLFN